MSVITNQVSFERSIKELPTDIQNIIYYNVLSINKLKSCHAIKKKIKCLNFAIKFNLRIKLIKSDCILINSLTNNPNQWSWYQSRGFTSDIKIMNVLMRNRFKNATILNIKVKTDHDGYDCDGPKSNLITLYVLYENNGKYIDEFYWENYWTSSCLKNEFEFIEKIKITDDQFNFSKFK